MVASSVWAPYHGSGSSVCRLSIGFVIWASGSTEHKVVIDISSLFLADIDECSNNEYPCPEQATCVNNEGEFECVCPEGYVGDGKDYCTGIS